MLALYKLKSSHTARVCGRGVGRGRESNRGLDAGSSTRKHKRRGHRKQDSGAAGSTQGQGQATPMEPNDRRTAAAHLRPEESIGLQGREHCSSRGGVGGQGQGVARAIVRILTASERPQSALRRRLPRVTVGLARGSARLRALLTAQHRRADRLADAREGRLVVGGGCGPPRIALSNVRACVLVGEHLGDRALAVGHHAHLRAGKQASRQAKNQQAAGKDW